MKMNKKGQFNAGTGFLLFLMFVIVGLLTIMMIRYSLQSGTEFITVKEKWRKLESGTEDYRIISTSGEVFVVRDSLINKQWESATLFANIKEGSSYTIQTQGFRFGVLDMFKNIVSYQEANIN